MSQVLDSLHHIALTVADIEQSVEWYTTSFHCEVLYHERTEAMIQFDNIRLQLFLPSQQPPHIACVRSDAKTFGELREHRDGMQSTFVADPTGNVVELIQKEDENENSS